MMKRALHIESCHEDWLKKMQPHQKAWHASVDDAYRNILIDRRRGVSMSMAVEAVEVANRTGRTQVFVGATKDQAWCFYVYALHWYGEDALKDFDLRFESPITLAEALEGLVEYDIYIDCYLHIGDEYLTGIQRDIEAVKPCRTTWIAYRHESPKFQLIEKVTHGFGESGGERFVIPASSDDVEA